VLDMDYYYHKVRRYQNEQSVKFSLAFGNIWNWIAHWLPIDVAERGNCAHWTSKGLVECQLLKTPSLFPKRIFVNLFERNGLNNPNNVNVVSYRRVKHAHQTYGEPEDPWISGVAPLAPITNLLYFNLEKFAHVIVEVPPGSTKAEIRKQKHPAAPNWYRYNWYSLACAGLLFLFAARMVMVRSIPKYFQKRT